MGEYVDLEVRLPDALAQQLYVIARNAGITVEELTELALAEALYHSSSRARREGRYVGHAKGKAVRAPALHPDVRSAKARTVLRRRTLAFHRRTIAARVLT